MIGRFDVPERRWGKPLNFPPPIRPSLLSRLRAAVRKRIRNRIRNRMPPQQVIFNGSRPPLEGVKFVPAPKLDRSYIPRWPPQEPE